MSIEPIVWTDADVDIWFFSEPGTTTLENFIAGTEPELSVEEGDLLLAHCYRSSGSISAASPNMARRGVTGRGARKLVSSSKYYDDVSLDLSWFLFDADKEVDMDDIFNSLKRLRIVVDLFNFNNVEKTFTLCLARAVSFNLTGSDADPFQGSAQFMAEYIK